MAFIILSSSAHAATFTVTTTAGNNSAGSLISAINQANANTADKDTINFNIGGSATIFTTEDLPALTGPVDIVGPGSDQLTIDADDFEGHDLFQTTKDLSLSGMTLINGGRQNGNGINGGAVSSTDSNLIVQDVIAINCRAWSGHGGGLYVNGGTVTVEGSAFVKGRSRNGGGIWIDGASDVSISNTVMDRNTSQNYFSGDEGPTYGGGLYVKDSPKVDITNATFQGNRSNNGAAFWISGAGKVTMSSSRAIENISSVASLPLPVGYKDDGTAKIAANETTVTNSRFTGNQSDTLAGLELVGPATVTDSLFNENIGSSGGAGLNMTAAEGQTTVSKVSNSTITDNKAMNYGVGLFSTGDVEVDSTTISGNQIVVPVYKEINGAGLFQMQGTATVTNSIISGNEPADVSAVRTVPESTQPNNDFGGYVQGSYSLIGENVAGPFKELVAGSNINSTNPKLGLLADNGGPTETMLPAEDSPVIDAGKSSLTTDQRGQTRPVAFGWLPKPAGGNRADIGAVEVQSLKSPPIKFTFGATKINKKKGTATIKVKVPFAGKVQLRGSKTVKAFTKTAKKDATVTLTVKAKGKAAKALKKKGKAKVKASVTYTIPGVKPNTQSKTVKLVKKKKK